MSTLQQLPLPHYHYHRHHHLNYQNPRLVHFKIPNSFSFSKKLLFSSKFNSYGVLRSRLNLHVNNYSDSNSRSCCCCKANGDDEVEVSGDELRPPFDINMAVVLAGFAFEAYTTPPENVGKREVDASNCQTIFLSESFVREIYDGRLFIKLKRGFNFPAMDPWGTSDPYVVMELDSQVVKSKVKWGTKEPTWNEECLLNIKQPPIKNLQVAAWDANLVTPYKRMGNSEINLESFCDGDVHEVLVELGGMGGGGKIELEIKYKSFEKIDEEKEWWKIPMVTDFLQKHGFESALKKIIGSETVQPRQFVEFAFGQLKSLNDTYIQSNISSNNESSETETEGSQSDKHFWKKLASTVNKNVIEKLSLPVPIPEKIKLDGFELVNKIGLQSRDIAESVYVESGLATPKDGDDDNITASPSQSPSQSQSRSQTSSLPDIKKITQDLLKQTDVVLGALMVVNATVSQFTQGGETLIKKDDKKENALELDEKETEEMKALFSKAESAMEAWAMLATSLGHSSFIKSEFEKICFLDNPSTDTQLTLWRDPVRKRLVVAFRGTEQTKWKDLLTDLMLVPAGLNPERIGGDFKEEVQVHSGFLSAYDSVRTRLLTLIKQAVGLSEESKWHVYVTGHSLGGALATLLALELSSTQLAKRGAICVTMYNFGSPRVGNKKFADIYNQKIKDSWRVVNHRDIIPTVPRLMGYYHVAQPVYLAPGGVANSLESVKDGYEGDIIGEATPDVLVSEFMKGEKQLIEKILNTEINIFLSIRDGSAVMQHMEDFYYVTLLEHVKSNYRTLPRSQLDEDNSLSKTA